MNLLTKYHGEIEYKEEDIINFEQGLLGFEELKKFIIFSLKDNEVFSVIHSVERGDIGFVVVSPFNVRKDYEFKLEDKTIETLSINEPTDVMVYNIVTLNSEVNKITVNLRAPLVINIVKKLGEQVILNNEKYLVKSPLIQEEK